MNARTGCRLAALATLAAIDLAVPAVMAAPTGGQVVAGTATVSTQGARTDIVQSSERTVIDWRSFGIARGEAVYFHQSPSMIALNRVTGDQASQLHGTLAASGQVILLNPNGILIGSGARVDAGSFVASTAWLAERDFMAGRLQFSAPPRNADGTCPWSRCAGGSVVNEGVVTTNREGGLAAFVAPHVRNEGQVLARLGTAFFGAASSFTLDLAGDGLVRLAVSPAQAARLDLRAEDTASPTDVRGARARAFIEHGGTTSAPGGRVVVLAPAAAAAVVDDVIHLGGIVRADTIASGPRGSIELRAAGGGVRIDGELGAIATQSGDAGGRIDVAARTIAFGDQARVSGGRGGALELAYVDAGARVVGSTARVLGDALASGTDVHVQADGTARIEARVDGRSAAPGQGGALAVDAHAIAISDDVLVSGRGLRLTATRGDLEMAKSVTPLAAGRSVPILHADAGTITLTAERNVVAHHLVTSGDVDVASRNGNVELRERLGRGEHGPIGGLRVRALGVPIGDDPNSIGSVGNIAFLRDVAVRPGGQVDLAATTNIRLMEGAELQRGRPSTERIGLLAARRGEDGRSLVMQSARLTASGDLAGDAWYWDPQRVNSQSYHEGPGANTVGTDGRWTDLALTAKSGVTPTLPSPGPVNVADLPTTRLALAVLPPAPAPTIIPALPDGAAPAALLPSIAGAAPSGGAAPPAFALVASSAGTLDPVLPSGDVHADDEDGPELGGRGVAQEADLGQRRTVVAQRDVFGQRGHVVRARPCDAGPIAGNTWFATGAFGQSIPTGCR